MTRYRLSREAQDDIDHIWDFIATDDAAAAAQFTTLLAEKFAALAHQPGMGRNCDTLLPGLRRFPVGNYLIFYRIHANAIEVARVLHGARDIEQLFHDATGA